MLPNLVECAWDPPYFCEINDFIMSVGGSLSIQSLIHQIFQTLRKVPLRLVLILPFVIEIFAVVGLVGWLSFWHGQEAVGDLTTQLRREVSTHISQYLETYLKNPVLANQITVDALRTGLLKLADRAGLERHLVSQLQQFKSVIRTGIAFPSGKYVGAERQPATAIIKVSSSGGELTNPTLSSSPPTWPWYTSAVTAHKPVMALDQNQTHKIISASYPFYDAHGELLAVISTDLALIEISHFLAGLKSSGQAFIIDPDGWLIATSSSAEVERTKLVKATASSNALIYNTANYLRQYLDFTKLPDSSNLNLTIGHTPHLLQVVPYTLGKLKWLIVVALPETVFMERIHVNRYFTILLSLLALLIAIGLGVLTSQWIIQPLLRLNIVAKDFSKGVKSAEYQFENHSTFTLPSSRFTPNELVELTQSFVRMAKQLQTLFTTLEAKNVDLQRLDKLKDEFLANTSHELRTPLNGIIGITEALIDGSTGPTPPETKANLSMIVASGRRLSRLVDDILDFSKLKNKNLELQLQSVNLREITEVVIALSRPLLGRKTVQLVNLIPNNLPLAQADNNRVQQILHNLIGNAIKFTERGNIEVAAKVVERKRGPEKKNWLAITVADTGIGIPSDKTSEIFESFEQLPGYHGTGLGLAVTRQLVRLHGGEIWVESTVGEGSRFTFTLPISASQKAPVKESDLLTSPPQSFPLSLPNKVHELTSLENIPVLPSGVHQLKPADANHFVILIVDDEPVNLHVLINHLSLYNYVTISASSGLETLEVLEKGCPDLILLDVMMPHMTGYEVTRRIREKWGADELPIILLTAKNQESDLITGLEIGANDYLVKPVSKNELLARIKTHIHIKQLKAETLQLAIESEKRLRQFLEAIPVGVFVMDAHGHPYYANQRAQQLLGKGVQSEITTEHFTEFYQIYSVGSQQLYPHEKLPAVCALKGEKTTTEDLEIHQPDKIVPLEVWGTPIFNEQGSLSYAIMAFQDITERKQAEQERIEYADKLFHLNKELENYLHTLEEKVEERTHALRESQAILADAQRMALLGSWVWDIKTGRVQRSAQDCRNFQIEPEQYVPTYEAFVECIHPEDRDIMGAMVEKCIIEGKTAEFEFRVIWPDSQIRTMRSQAELEFDDSGTPIRLKGFSQDITERKRIEVALQDQFKFIEDMLQAIPSPIFYKDSLGVYQGCNKAFEEFTGFHKEHIIGKTLFGLWPSAVAQLHHQDDLTFLRQPGVQVYESKMPHVDGTEHHIISTKATYTNAAGQVIGLVGVITDINERKRTEEALRLAQFSLDRSADGIQWIKPNGRHLYVNEALSKMLGYLQAELLSMSISDVNPNFPAHRWEERWNAYKHQGSRTFETYHRRKDGSLFPVEITANYLEYHGNEYLCAFIRDITERKLAEEKLQQAKLAAETALQQLKATQQQLIESAKMAELGNLVAGVAHEINTPIGIGVTAASRLQTLTEEITQIYQGNAMKRADLEKYLKSANQGCDLILKNLTRAAELIQSFKQVAVDQTGDKARTFELKKYLHEILTSLRPEFKRTKHQVVIECDENITLSSYPGVFSQIITNLIMNSLIHGFKDKAEGKMVIAASVRLLPSENSKNVKKLILRYGDNGRGIPPEVIGNIYDPFFTTNRQGGGSGLGMHIVYNLVTHKLNGIIRCESVMGEGTTFILEIPIPP